MIDIAAFKDLTIYIFGLVGFLALFFTHFGRMTGEFLTTFIKKYASDTDEVHPFEVTDKNNESLYLKAENTNKEGSLEALIWKHLKKLPTNQHQKYVLMNAHHSPSKIEPFLVPSVIGFSLVFFVLSLFLFAENATTNDRIVTSFFTMLSFSATCYSLYIYNILKDLNRLYKDNNIEIGLVINIKSKP